MFLAIAPSFSIDFINHSTCRNLGFWLILKSLKQKKNQQVNQMILDYSTLQVGQEVSIARSGNWSTSSQGVYKVIKVNKIKVVLEREDGVQREFSVKTKKELGVSYDSKSFIETLGDKLKRDAEQYKQQKLGIAWVNLQQAVLGKDFKKIKQSIAELENLGVE